MAIIRVKKITCGVLFKKSFSILDNWGKIADNLLYDNKSPFDTKYFPKISSQYTHTRFLENPEKGHRWELTPDNIIYSHTIQMDFEKEFNQFARNMSNYIIPNIIQRNNLVVRRIGIVYECEVDNESLSEIVSKYFTSDLTNIIDCRFACRDIVPSSLIFKDTNDYVNKIYSIVSSEEGMNTFGFDYQLFFIPNIVDLKSRANKFFENSKIVFKQEVLKEKASGK